MRVAHSSQASGTRTLWWLDAAGGRRGRRHVLVISSVDVRRKRVDRDEPSPCAPPLDSCDLSVWPLRQSRRASRPAAVLLSTVSLMRGIPVRLTLRLQPAGPVVQNQMPVLTFSL